MNKGVSTRLMYALDMNVVVVLVPFWVVVSALNVRDIM